MLINNTPSNVYPFTSLSILGCDIIKDIRLLVPLNSYNIKVALIRTAADYLFIGIQGTLLSGLLFYGTFLSNSLLSVTLACPSNPLISGKLLLYKLPTLKKNFIQSKANELHLLPSSIVYYNNSAFYTQNIEFVGMLTALSLPQKNAFLIYRNQDPGYYLNLSSDPANKLTLDNHKYINKVNRQSVNLTLCLKNNIENLAIRCDLQGSFIVVLLKDSSVFSCTPSLES